MFECLRPALFEMSSGARTCLKVSVFEYLAAIRYCYHGEGVFQMLDARPVNQIVTLYNAII